MYSHIFQTGDVGVEVLTASGKAPAKDWKIQGGVHRVYDKTTKGFVFLMEKGINTRFQSPANSADTLGLIQPMLVFQIKGFTSKPLGIEIVILDQKSQRRRLHFSTKFKVILCSDLHSQIPLIFTHSDQWNNLIFDLKNLTSTLFNNIRFASIDSINITPACKIRKIFTLPLHVVEESGGVIPETFQYPPQTEFFTQVSSLINLLYFTINTFPSCI